jgi:heme/copper-type cytochrome/quinol oxidase subunit 2
MRGLNGVYFRESAAEALDGMIFSHDYIMCISLVILGIVVRFTLAIVYSLGIRLHRKKVTNMDVRDRLVRARLRPYGNGRNKVLEIVWTLFPALILGAIAVPSFSVLYAIERPRFHEIVVKVHGSQWFWSYSIVVDLVDEMKIYRFDSYMKSEEELAFGELRLLEVDNPLILPVKVGLKFLVSAEDVVHSFSVTELGIKMDAVPGRANRVWTSIERTGVFRGQCSELCGVNHGFMPIVIHAVPYNDFPMWLDVKMREV